MSEKAKTRRTKKKAAAAAAAGGRDRFKNLPVEVLELLLSFLPSKDAVRTCVLAKRWRHIWKSVPSLRINGGKFKTAENYSYFVNRLLELRDPTVPLHVCDINPYRDPDADAYAIESCLQYAVSCQVQVLQVENFFSGDNLDLSNKSVISEHLTRLVLFCVQFELDYSLDLGRCEALEVLDLQGCHINLGDISFAKSLRHLILKGSELYPGNIRTRISAPGLVTCELADCFGFTPLFGSLPSVTTAFIRIQSESEEDCEGYCEEYCEGFFCKNDCSVLLEGLSDATSLELICDDDCVIFTKDLKWRPTFGKLKTVLLNDWCMADNFTGLVYFLQHSPTLERLTLQLSPSSKYLNELVESYTPREHFLVSKYLKVVEIKSYKLKGIQICQIGNLLGTLGVTREKITIDEEFKFSEWFSFETKK